MNTTDFFQLHDEPNWSNVMNGDPWADDATMSSSVFNLGLMKDLRQGQIDGRSDLEVAIALAELLHDDLRHYGTDSQQQLDDQETAAAITALAAVTRRLGIRFSLPFRNQTGFRSYWLRNNGSGSWEARRAMLDSLFDPLHQQLIEMENRSFEALARPVSPREATGWPMVDEEIRELRRRFQTSQTPQDYRDVGNHCIGVLEALSRTVYDPTKHQRPGEDVPPVDKTKQRLGRYVEESLGGADNFELRGLVTKAVEFAQKVKHDLPSRRDAGIAADSVILLANILKRLEEEF